VLAILLTPNGKLAILCRRQMRLISIPVLRDHAVLNTEHIEPKRVMVLAVLSGPGLAASAI